jgi:hypothetical protein
MGYALRRDEGQDDGDHAKPGEGLRDVLGRWAERIREALHMSSSTGFGPAFHELSQLHRLPVNWNGHGAAAPPETAVQKATAVLRQIDQKFGSLVPPPTVGSVPGGVVFVWRVKRGPAGREIEREVEMLFFERANEWAVADRDGIEPTISGENVDPDTFLRLIDRYIVA